MKVKRLTKLSVKVKCVKFSPEGRSFAIATSEGVFIYSADQTQVFLPLELDESITLKKLIQELKFKNYMRALIMALKLNQEKIVHNTLYLIPED